MISNALRKTRTQLGLRVLINVLAITVEQSPLALQMLYHSPYARRETRLKNGLISP